MKRAFAWLILFALLTSAEAAVPERSYSNLTYSAPHGKKLRLDLYVPTGVEKPPLIVWFHGGGWRYGDKRIRFFLRDLTSQGFAVATVQYRLTWSAHWPAQREDCLAAVRWLRSNAVRYGYRQDGMGLGGDSAGGHLAALVGLLEKKPRIKAVATLYPVTDLLELGEIFRSNPRNLLVRLFGAPFEDTRQQAIEASPVNHVSRRSPDFLFIHGDSDETVPLAQSEKLNRLLKVKGVSSELIVVREKGHGFSPDRAMMKTITDFYKRELLGP